MRTIIPFLPILLVGGCASMSAESLRPVRYVCDDGAGFSVTYLPYGMGASIDIQGMTLELNEGPPGRVRQYTSPRLTLWREDEKARVFMQGTSLYANCVEGK